MPSGITAAIYEGENVSLRDYLMRVGRQMGYAVLQRDSDSGEPVKPTEPHTSYHDEALTDAQARLEQALGWSPEEAEEKARADFDDSLAAWRERRRKDAELRARYEAMIAEVEAWEPDPLIASTKENALKYLRESIDFDCPPNRSFDREPPKRLTGREYREQQVTKAERDLAYHTDERAKEIARTEERNAYIAAFLNSLPPAEVPA